MIQRSRRTPIWTTSLVIAVAACGGRAAVDGRGLPNADDDSSSVTTGEAPTTGASPGSGGTRVDFDPAGGSSSSAGGESSMGMGAAENRGGAGGSGSAGGCSGAPCQLAVHPEPLWATELDAYGLGPAWIRFVDGTDHVQVGSGEFSFSIATLNRTDGLPVESHETVADALAFDQEGRVLVRAVVNEGAVVFVDGQQQMSIAGFRQNDQIHLAPDGSAVSHHFCMSTGDELIELDVYDTESGSLIASLETDLPCYYIDSPIFVDTVYRRTLFSNPGKSELFVFDWGSNAISALSIHQPAPISTSEPRNNEGTILHLGLSPDGSRLSSIGAADGLALLDRRTLELQSRLESVPYFNLYDACFCHFHSESPLAWSADGRVFAVASETGGISLYDGTTHDHLAELDPPLESDIGGNPFSTELGPARLAISNDLESLVALYPHYAVGYSLKRN